MLALALAERRVLLTFDKDFRELAFRRGQKATPGVILLRSRLRSPDYLVRFARAVLAQGHAWEGHFAVAEEGRLRLVPLPTRSFPDAIPRPTMTVTAKKQIPPFSSQHLEGISKALGDTTDGLKGSEIVHLLRDCDMPDPAPAITKWQRLYNAFAEDQNRAQIDDIGQTCQGNMFQQVQGPIRVTWELPMLSQRSSAMEELRPHELQRDFGSEDEIVIKEWYDHKNQPWSHEVSTRSPSIYVMFRKDFTLVHCCSGNELRRVYLENPDEYISEPLYLAIPRYLQARIEEWIENF